MTWPAPVTREQLDELERGPADRALDEIGRALSARELLQLILAMDRAGERAVTVRAGSACAAAGQECAYIAGYLSGCLLERIPGQVLRT